MSESPTANTVRNVRRWPWRRYYDFVAVRPIRMGRHVIQPGEPAAVGGRPLRRYHLMSLYRRRLIGAADDPWTRGELARYGVRLEREHDRAPDREPGALLRLLRSLGLAAAPEALAVPSIVPAGYVASDGVRTARQLAAETAALLEMDSAEWNAMPETDRADYLREAAEQLGWTPVEGS